MSRRPALAACLGLAFALVASAAPPDVKAPEKVVGDVGAFIPLRTETTGKFTRFYVLDKGLNVFPADLLTDKKATVVSAAKAGNYRVLAFSGNADGPGEPTLIVVTVGTPAPGPTPPPPGPEPQPEPQPVDPTTKSPFSEPGFRVLFVIEKDDLTTYPPGQFNSMEAKAVKDYLNAKCVKGADGRTPEWRMYDQHIPLTNAPKMWQDVMARPRASLPWVVIGDGVKGFEGPVPFNKDNPTDIKPMLDLLAKFGGN